MNIGLLTQEYPLPGIRFGGVGSAMAKMARWLADHGHNVTVYLQGSRAETVDESEMLRIERVPPVSRLHWRLEPAVQALPASMRGMLWHRDLNAALEHRILADYRAGRIEVLLANRGVTAPGLMIHRRLPTVVRVQHAMPRALRVEEIRPRWTDHLLHRAEQRAIGRADRVYCASRVVADYVGRDVGRPIQVIPTPMFDVHAERRIWSDLVATYRLPEKFMIYWGGFLFCKGVDVLLRALPAYLDAVPDGGFVWVGAMKYQTPAHRRMQEEMNTLQTRYPSRVCVLPGLDHAELLPMISHARAAVLPSVFDNLPNTVLEAMHEACPVIGTTGASLDELIEHDVEGLLVSPHDADGLAAAMIRLAGLDETARQSMGEAARTTLNRLCSPADVMPRIVEVCEEAIEHYSNQTRKVTP